MNDEVKLKWYQRLGKAAGAMGLAVLSSLLGFLQPRCKFFADNVGEVVFWIVATTLLNHALRWAGVL
jgi:hypothetical protein